MKATEIEARGTTSMGERVLREKATGRRVGSAADDAAAEQIVARFNTQPALLAVAEEVAMQYEAEQLRAGQGTRATVAHALGQRARAAVRAAQLAAQGIAVALLLALAACGRAAEPAGSGGPCSQPKEPPPAAAPALREPECDRLDREHAADAALPPAPALVPGQDVIRSRKGLGR